MSSEEREPEQGARRGRGRPRQSLPAAEPSGISQTAHGGHEEEDGEPESVARRGRGRPRGSVKVGQGSVLQTGDDESYDDQQPKKTTRGRGWPPGSGKARRSSVAQTDIDESDQPDRGQPAGQGRNKKVSWGPSQTLNVPESGKDDEPTRKPGRPVGSGKNRQRSGHASTDESGNEVDMTGLSQDLAHRVRQFPGYLLENHKRTQAFLSRQADENTMVRILERFPDVENGIDDVWTAEDVEGVRSTFEDSEAWTLMRDTLIVNKRQFWSM